MTLPTQGATPEQESDALTSITRMLTGTQMLKDEPGVVYALAQQRAHPADAQTIDQFMQGLDLEKQVRIAQSQGQQIALNGAQKSRLDALGVNYSTVEYTHQDAITDTAKLLDQQGAGQGLHVRRDDQGNPVLVSGQLVMDKEQHKAKGIGRLFHDLNNWIAKPVMRDVLKPVGNVAMKGYNFVSTAVSDQYGQNTSGLHGGAEKTVQTSESREADMRAQGYDPNNIWSRFAFQSSGKAHSDLTSLGDQWDSDHPSGLYGWDGTQATAEASRFLDDPKKYERDIINDPTLTPTEISDKLSALSSPDFVTLARRVQGRTASIGNDFTNALGIDPVKHSTAYAITSAGANLAASFMLDPLLVAGNVYRVARLSQVGLDTIGDSATAAKVLDSTVSTGHWQRGLQAKTQQFMDLAHQMGAADAAGDKVTSAAISARISAQFKEWAPMVPDVLGKNQIVSYTTKIENGKRIAEPVFGEGQALHTVGDFANYIASKNAMIRLMNSRAAVQSSLMPGAVSSFGLRALKGKTAEWMTTRSATRAEAAYATVVSRAEADPALAKRLIDEGMLLRTQPEADDAINALDGTVLAAKGEAEGGEPLASAARGQLEVTPAGRGAISFNLRSHGTPLGTRTAGWATPTAIAARGRLAAQRLSTLLPRNTVIDINDSASSDKIYKLAMTYMNRGDANAIKAAWDVGDGGQRKAIVHGVLDQLAHASGLTKTKSGQQLLDVMKTRIESYSTVGDEITLNGDNLALHAGQVRSKWILPTFRDLQMASSKIGLWEATFGRALTTQQADMLMSQWKLGALFKPSTVTRNQLEGWMRTAIEGKLGDSLKARAYATAPNKELWAKGMDSGVLDTFREARGKVEGLETMLKDKGLSLEQRANARQQIADAKLTMNQVSMRPIVLHLLANEAGDTKLAKQISEGTLLSGDVLGRSAIGTRIAKFAPFALTGRAYRAMFGRAMSEEDVAALETLGADELTQAMEGYGAQITESDLGFRNAARQSSEVAKAGYGPSLLKRAVHRSLQRAAAEPGEGHALSWTQHDTDGTVGADRFANALAQRVNATPSVAHAVLDRIESPEEFQIDNVVAALDDPTIAAKMHLTGYGSVYWADPEGPALRATTDAEVLIGKQEWAQRIVNDYHYLLTGQNGEYTQAIADYVREHGVAPDADWITSHLEGAERPVSVLAPEIVAMPKDGPQGLFATLQDIEGAGYQWMVERPLQRTTSSPVFLANYAAARRGLNPFVDKLVEQGIGRDAAENLAKELSVRNSWIKTEQLIDDPGQKSQFDIVARNIFPFSRATQAMIRRWGSGLWQDPTRAQRFMLAYEGAVHSGFIYTNAYGEPTFAYPGSGVMNLAMRQLAKVPGFEGLNRFPVSATMTGGVLMSVPGADNPFRMSAGPMITIPTRELSKLLPGHDRLIFDEIDAAMNGPVGQGQTLGSLIPTVGRRFYQALSTNDRNSAMASSMTGAIANLAAAGKLPAADATPAQRQEFLNNLRTQVRSQLFLRAVFGLIAPASPTQPTEGLPSSQADYAFHIRGAGQLSDEYKTILNDAGGDLARANAIWTALHPDKTVYEIGHSSAAASHVYLPATQAALEWMNSNAGFVHKYGSIAAYFLPESVGNEPFNDQAYKTQLELGLRQRKTPDEFMNDVYVRHAESVFYPAVQGFDDKIAAAKAAGDQATASNWTQAKSDWETQFKNLNPLFQAKIDSYPAARATALGQLQNIRQMLSEGDVPDSMAPLLQKLINTYDGFEQFSQAHKGSDAQSLAMRDQAREVFNSWIQAHILNSPLADLYSGVFRTLDTNFVNLTPQGSTP